MNEEFKDIENNTTDTYVDKVAYKYFKGIYTPKSDSIQTKLREAHMPITAELYFARLLLYVTITALITIILTGVSMYGLNSIGLFQEFIDDSTLIYIIMVVSTLLITVLVSGFVGFLYYIRPSYSASRRANKIDANLDSALVFLFALNRGGLNLTESIRLLAQNDEIYGEAASEFGTVIQDIDYFSTDIIQALRRAGKRSASEKFRNLTEDLISTMDSGAPITPFLESKANDLIEDKERKQNSFIETLGLLGQVYVIAFVAGPMFMIIMTVIMALVGGADASQLYAIVYGLLPFMVLGYYVLVDTLSESGSKKAYEIPIETQFGNDEKIRQYLNQEDDIDKRVEKFYKNKKRREQTELLTKPIEKLKTNPNLILYFTIPITLIYLILAPLLGFVELSIDAFVEEPVIQTVLTLIIPLLILFGPLMIFFELKTRREKKILYRLPDSLNQLASANSVGMSLTEALEAAADTTKGKLGAEYRLVKNDIRWNNDVNLALIKFSNRMKIPTLTRTVKLITAANEATGDIEEVISIAAENVKNQVDLEKERVSELSIQTYTIVMSFFIYMFIIAALDYVFLDVIDSMAEDGTDGDEIEDAGEDAEEFDVTDLDTDMFRLVFYHSTLVLGFGSGLIAGYLRTNDIRSGLKFGLILIIISSLVFYLV